MQHWLCRYNLKHKASPCFFFFQWETVFQQVGTNNLFKLSLSHFSNHKQVLHLELVYVNRNVNTDHATLR